MTLRGKRSHLKLDFVVSNYIKMDRDYCTDEKKNSLRLAKTLREVYSAYLPTPRSEEAGIEDMVKDLTYRPGRYNWLARGSASLPADGTIIFHHRDLTSPWKIKNCTIILETISNDLPNP